MRQITTTNGTRVTIGSNAEASALNEGPETTANFLLALDDALSAGGRCRFVANGTHYSLNNFNEVDREDSGPYRAPKWNPRGTAVTWSGDEGNGIDDGTGIATGVYFCIFGVTYYNVTNDADGFTYWITNPTRRH